MTLALIAPGAASVASPPLVVGGMLVGLLLLGSFAYMLSRTFQNMSDIQPEDRVTAATQNAADLSTRFETHPSTTVLNTLVDGIRTAESESEASAFVTALTGLTGRYFKSDVVAWESWVRREGSVFVADYKHTARNTVQASALPLSS